MFFALAGMAHAAIPTRRRPRISRSPSHSLSNKQRRCISPFPISLETSECRRKRKSASAPTPRPSPGYVECRRNLTDCRTRPGSSSQRPSVERADAAIRQLVRLLARIAVAEALGTADPGELRAPRSSRMSPPHTANQAPGRLLTTADVPNRCQVSPARYGAGSRRQA